MLLLVLSGSSPLLRCSAVGASAGSGPTSGSAREGRLRQERIERDLPDFLDILAVTVRAGLGYRPALLRVAEALGGPVGEEVLTALRQMDLGANRRDAFLAMCDAQRLALAEVDDRRAAPGRGARRAALGGAQRHRARTCAAPRTRTRAGARRAPRRACR